MKYFKDQMLVIEMVYSAMHKIRRQDRDFPVNPSVLDHIKIDTMLRGVIEPVIDTEYYLLYDEDYHLRVSAENERPFYIKMPEYQALQLLITQCYLKYISEV